MKLVLITAVVALTVAQATGHYIPNEQEKTINLNHYLDNMKARVNQDMSEMMNKHNLPAQARTLLERQQAELQAIPEHAKEVFSEVERNINKAMDNLQNKFRDIMQKMTGARS